MFHAKWSCRPYGTFREARGVPIPPSPDLPVDSLYAESFHSSVVQLRENAPVNGLDLHIAHVLNRLLVASDAGEMSVEAIVPRPRGIPVCDDVLVLVQVDTFVTHGAEKNFGTHGLHG